jgi:hypothetical protein
VYGHGASRRFIPESEAPAGGMFEQIWMTGERLPSNSEGTRRAKARELAGRLSTDPYGGGAGLTTAL